MIPAQKAQQVQQDHKGENRDQQDQKGATGATGPQGAKGDAFSIAKTYASISAMNAGYASDGVKIGQFVMIDTGNVEDADNAKLYVKGATAYTFITDLSGAKGMTGPQGPRGATGATGPQGLKAIPAPPAQKELSGKTPTFKNTKWAFDCCV